jgi:hypothetical protein
MMTRFRAGSDTFEMTRDLVDVTSNNRPHVGCVVVDKAGHAHPYCGPDGKPATHYDPSIAYTIPSTVWVKDGEEYWEDDNESHEVGHYECRECHEAVIYPRTADLTGQSMAGLTRCYINGVEATREEFERRCEAAKKRDQGRRAPG